MTTDLLPMRPWDSTPLWSSGRFAVRVEGSRRGPVEMRRPYAVVGQSPDCDVVINDPHVAPDMLTCT